MAAVEGFVECFQEFGGARIVGAHDDAVRLHEVIDCRTFLEKLGVGYNVKLDRRATLVQCLAYRECHFVRRAHRHRRLIHHDAIVVHVFADGTCHGEDVLQVRRSIFVGRCANGNKLEQAMVDGLLDISRKFQPACFAVALDVAVEARLVNGHFAVVQARDFLLIDVIADHVISGLRHAGASDQADVS